MPTSQHLAHDRCSINAYQKDKAERTCTHAGSLLSDSHRHLLEGPGPGLLGKEGTVCLERGEVKCKEFGDTSREVSEDLSEVERGGCRERG